MNAVELASESSAVDKWLLDLYTISTIANRLDEANHETLAIGSDQFGRPQTGLNKTILKYFHHTAHLNCMVCMYASLK